MDTSIKYSHTTTSAQLWLKNLLEEKSKHDIKFSLRAFARQVEISPAALSRILNGKRRLTFAIAVRIADSLKFGPQEREKLFAFYRPEEEHGKEKSGREMSLDCFIAMKEWYHYGITQLLQVENFREDYKWMSKILDVSELEIKLALDRLIRLEMIERNESGHLVRSKHHMITSPDIAASGIRHFQKQILERSIISLERDPLEEKDITSITLAINEEKLEEAKKEIKKFRIKMAQFLSEGPKSRVYNLGIHLIPLSKSTKLK